MLLRKGKNKNILKWVFYITNSGKNKKTNKKDIIG